MKNIQHAVASLLSLVPPYVIFLACVGTVPFYLLSQALAAVQK